MTYIRTAAEYCRILEVQPDATVQQIRRGHRRMVLIWHPDRFKANPELYAEAEEKLRLINEAYEFLSKHPPSSRPVQPPQGPPVADKPPSTQRNHAKKQRDSSVDERKAPPAPDRAESRRSAGPTRWILLVVVIICGLGIVTQIGKDRQRAASVPIDPWISYRDSLVARINQRSGNPFHHQVNNDVQFVLMQITRDQMNSAYVQEANVAFMRDLFARTGPCMAPTDFWHCRWYPVAMNAELLNSTDILVTGFMRSPYPSYSDRDNTEFAIVFRRAGSKWLLLPPPTYRDTRTE